MKKSFRMKPKKSRVNLIFTIEIILIINVLPIIKYIKKVLKQRKSNFFMKDL